MPANPRPLTTDFTRDVLGRYVCNGLDEARRSADPTAVRADGRPQVEARPFDVIVIGGGTFGAVLAEHLCFRDRARQHRVLVLEGGPLVLAEHVQNLPALGLGVPSATSIQQLKADGNFGPDQPQSEVWGLPWHSAHPFPGLAYCLGGRSLFWGGWSPELLKQELPDDVWPADVRKELTGKGLAAGSAGYFQQASDQIGVTQTNDFIFGELHRAARDQLFAAIKANQISGAVALSSLPDHPAVRYAATPPSSADLARLLGLPPGAVPPSDADAKQQLKLEAPLAVQGESGHAGFFPFNKFSSAPLLIKAAREAFAESRGDDARKRLMIVPRCHVSRLVTVQYGSERRVTAIETNQGTIDVPAGGKVILALGTIESTRLALVSFKDIPAPAYGRIGTNLMAHLRSNLDIRIPRTNLASLPATVKALQASALFVKGRHAGQNGEPAHFHLQITASGLGAIGGNSEAELFKKIPDIDSFDAHRGANDTHVVITIRGIGEMQPENPGNRVGLDPNPAETDEFGVQRALVSIANPGDAATRAANPKAERDFQLWKAMDQAAKDVAKAFGVAQPPEPSRDGLGTTHHESGTLYMGEPTSDSVALPDGRLRHVTNAYVAGPALFPTIGSPNPMLTGVALARRLGDHLGSPQPFQAEPGFDVLFNGFDTGKWRMTTIRDQGSGRDNPGSMRVIDGALETVAGNDMGIFWCTTPTPANFILKLQWLRWTHDSNSGVYLRFPDPDSKGYRNTAFVADDCGFEVQIDELGAPDGAAIHRTGAIYRKDGRTDGEKLTLKAARGVGEWNDYEIRVEGQRYTVRQNGDVVCVFDNTNLYANRGLASTPAAPAFIGLQVYANPRYFTRFRRIQIKALP
jgi:choline dehydrogenase-like flavoprotein